MLTPVESTPVPPSLRAKQAMRHCVRVQGPLRSRAPTGVMPATDLKCTCSRCMSLESEVKTLSPRYAAESHLK